MTTTARRDNMTATIHFTSSETYMEYEPRACAHAEIEAIEYVEGTYDTLRTGPNGDAIAHYLQGAWELIDGRRFSDWAVKIQAN